MVSALSWMEKPMYVWLECLHSQDCEWPYLLTRALITFRSTDPLESEDTLLLSLEMVANIARTKYTESGRVIVHKFQELLLKYRELIQRASALSGTSTPPIGASDVKESLMVTEMQLTWMVYIMAACIGGRVVSVVYFIFCELSTAVRISTKCLHVHYFTYHCTIVDVPKQVGAGSSGWRVCM